jgi:Protein of unknown function (DUF1153)
MKQPKNQLILVDIIEGVKSKLFRWTPARKAAVVVAVRDGRLSKAKVNEAGISDDELKDWGEKLDRFGSAALRSSRLHAYEPKRRRANKTRAARTARISTA